MEAIEPESIKILLIEDNPGDVRLIQEMLSEASSVLFDLECTDLLSTGLERLAAGDAGVILLDLRLPDSQGLDTFTRVHAQAPEVPIVVLTSLDDVTLAIKAVREGAQDYLIKNQLYGNLLIRATHYAIERKRAQERIRHLNSVLKAIRTVNQLVVLEKDRNSLLQKVCDVLIEARGYDAAWLGFLSDGGTFDMVKGCGFGADVSRFCEHVMDGDHPPCIRNALAQKDTLVVDKSSVCGDCFFKDVCATRETAIIRVEHADRLFGLLAILFASDVTADDEEKNLLKELAGDIAFAFHNVELGEAHKRAEGALWESEERLKTIFNSVQTGITIIDTETHVIVDANPVVVEMIGLPKGQIVGHVCHKFICPAEGGKCPITDLGQTVDKSERVLLNASGESIPILKSVVPTILDGRRRLLESFLDITERKQAEEALRQYTERLRTLRAIDGAILAAWSPEEIAQAALRHVRQLVGCQQASVMTLDLETQEAILFAVHANGEVRLGTGTRLPLEGVVDIETLRQGRVLVEQDLLLLSHPPPAIQAVQAAGVRSYVAVPLIAGGEVIGVLALGAESPGAFAPDHVDIAREVADEIAVALRQARLRAALEAEERRLEALVEHLPEGVLLLDDEQRIRLSNPAAQACLSILTDAVIGDVLTHLAGRPVEEILEPPPEGLWHELEAAGPPVRMFEMVAQQIAAEAGVGGWVLLVRDVTGEREVQQRIQQHDQLAVVGQLAAGIAHDFNNIMATIILYAQVLSQTTGLSSRNRERLATIKQQAKHATHLTQQILDFSRRSILEMQPLGLVLPFKELVKLLERTLPENIRVKLKYEAGECMVNADPTRVQQVMMNLALNARDAMPEGGELRIELEQVRIRPDEAPPLPEMEAGEWVRVTVSDTGTGMPPDVLPHIYEPFFTTKAPGKGSGLGLSQVYGIVAQHEGCIDVKSEVGRGTTFALYLPALPMPEVEPLMPEEVAVAEGHGETILVVEDSPATRTALKEVLEMLNYRVLVAVNGQEALIIFERHKDEIALVLSDMVMPEMGGKELVRELRHADPHVKALVITGYALAEDVQELKEEGILDVVQKPFEANVLAEIIRRVLDTD